LTLLTVFRYGPPLRETSRPSSPISCHTESRIPALPEFASFLTSVSISRCTVFHLTMLWPSPSSAISHHPEPDLPKPTGLLPFYPYLQYLDVVVSRGDGLALAIIGHPRHPKSFLAVQSETCELCESSFFLIHVTRSG
jgi:hypothetical protein